MKNFICCLVGFLACNYAHAESLVRVMNLNGNAQVKLTAYNATNGFIDLQIVTMLTSRTSEVRSLELAPGRYHLEISSDGYRSKVITFHTDNCLPPRKIEIPMTTDVGAKIAIKNVFGPELIEANCN